MVRLDGAFGVTWRDIGSSGYTLPARCRYTGAALQGASAAPSDGLRRGALPASAVGRDARAQDGSEHRGKLALAGK